jgi:eukaryotic-like serine/threonine-protein kinase
MPGESSSPDCHPPAETAHTPIPEECPGISNLTPTDAATLAAGGIASFSFETIPEGTATQRPAGENVTVAQERAAAAGSLPLRPSGRFPRFLGEYELIEEIARGGMGVVYRARQEKLNRLVAVKLIRSGSLAGDDDLRRFRHEAEAIADLDHPNIIPIYEIAQEDDHPYFSMKLIEGGNLTRHIERLKHDTAAAANLIAKVARAVHYAHQRTILHRDIKPSNILLAEHDEPYVTDFGLAKRIGPDSGTAATVTGAIMGTPAYMPPEQARGGSKSVTTAADIYSLGATLYETLTGKPPFGGDSPAEIIRQVLDQEPARLRSINPNIDRDLETICLKCLDKEPARRYGSAEALADDLERWRSGMPIAARRVPAWEKAIKWVKRRPEMAALVLVVHLALLGLIGGGIWFTFQLWKERDLADRGHYAADMNLAQRSLDDGSIYQAREQLSAYRTGRPKAHLRGFEWYYLANLCDQTPIRLRGHQKAVICVAFHPDGNGVVSGGTDGTVRVWDLPGRRVLHVFTGKGSPVHCVAVSPDGRWLAAGDARGGLRLWDFESHRERALAGHGSALRSVAFSRKSDQLLSCDAGGLIIQWDVSAGRSIFPLQHRRQENGVAPSVTGARSQEPYRGAIAAYGPNGQSIISVGEGQLVMIWDVATGQLLDQIPVGKSVIGLSVSTDRREVALAEEFPEIEILDLEKPHELRRMLRGARHRVGTVVFSPVGPTLAIAGIGKAGLLDAQSDRLLDRFDESVNMSPFAMAFGGGGNMLAMAAGDEIHVVHLARNPDGETAAASQGPIRRLAASPDERLLAMDREDGKIVVWDLLAKRVLQVLNGHRLNVFGLAFVASPRGLLLVSVGGDGLVQIWDPVAGGLPLHILSDHRGAVYSVAVRPDGRQFATGGEDGFVRIWDPATGQVDLPRLDHGASISALAYAPDNTALASGGMDSLVRVWSATSGRRGLGPISHPHHLSSLAFSPDARFLAGGGGAPDKGGTIVIWNASSGTISTEVKCPRGVDSLSFSSDSRRIATCGADAVVQVWDATGEHETLSLNGHGSRVSAVLFAPRDRLYSAGSDGVVKLWDGSTTKPTE